MTSCDKQRKKSDSSFENNPTKIKLGKLRNNREFHLVYKRGRSVVTKHVVMYYRKNGSHLNRLGISVSKKVGKAVVRNRAKRLIKESFRLNQCEIGLGYDIVFVARVRMKDAKAKNVNKDMHRVLKQLN